MNKNLIYSIIIVALLGLGLWWFISNTTPKDALAPTISTSVSPSASPTPVATKTPAAPKITMTSPQANALVDSPILVTGRANVFENQFTVQVKDSAGQVVATAHVFTDAKDAGQYGNYSVKIPIPAGLATSIMKVEALSYSAKGDGSFEGYASAPVKLKYFDTMSIYAAFSTSQTDCTAVTLFPHEITKTSQFPYMSLVELLNGPNDTDKQQGATTLIPSGVVINSFKQTGSTYMVDFNNTLQQGVAGSCRVQGIRAQIEGTLKQFLGINNVIISINGQTEGILQP